MNVAVHQLLDRFSPPRARGVNYPIGLHFGAERLSLAQMRPSASGIGLRAVASIDLGCKWDLLITQPRRLKQVLKRLWAEHRFNGTDVVACMPQEHLKVFSVDYTATDGQADAEAVAWEVKERLHGNVDGMVVDFVPVRQASSEERPREAVVAAAAREHVTSYLDLLLAAGLNVKALDIGPMALRRVVPWAGKAAGMEMQNALLINVGSACTHLMVVWGRRLMLERAIDFSEQRLVSRIKTLFDLSEHSARRLLVEHGFIASVNGFGITQLHAVLKEVLRSELLRLKAEVSKTLTYAASKLRGNTVEKAFLVGAIARYPGVAEFMNEVLGRPLELLNPFAIFPHSLAEKDVAELWSHSGVAVAIGLALRGMDGL
jgi:type IV pilus assembly protein PilM